MNPTSGHLHDDDLVAYALGESDAARAREIDAHLEACDECRREYVGLLDTLGTMAFAAPGRLPPPELRSAILAAAASEPRVPAAPAPAPAAGSPRRRRWSWAPLSGWGPRIAIAGGLAVVLIVALLALPQDTSPSRTVPLVGVHGAVVVTDHRAVLDAAGFGPLPSGRTYEMWVIHGGAARPAGLFAHGVGTVPVRGAVASGDVVAVTAEPSGGSPQPTSTPIAHAEVQ
jgi:anti-sigma-K factor RskA